MTARSRIRGRVVEYIDDKWVWEDTKEPVSKKDLRDLDPGMQIDDPGKLEPVATTPLCTCQTEPGEPCAVHDCDQSAANEAGDEDELIVGSRVLSPLGVADKVRHKATGKTGIINCFIGGEIAASADDDPNTIIQGKPEEFELMVSDKPSPPNYKKPRKRSRPYQNPQCQHSQQWPCQHADPKHGCLSECPHLELTQEALDMQVIKCCPHCNHPLRAVQDISSPVLRLMCNNRPCYRYGLVTLVTVNYDRKTVIENMKRLTSQARAPLSHGMPEGPVNTVGPALGRHAALMEEIQAIATKENADIIERHLDKASVQILMEMDVDQMEELLADLKRFEELKDGGGSHGQGN